MTRERVPREGVREGGREEGGGRIGKPGGCGERPILRERFFARRFFFSSFSADERESSCRAVSVQADFVTHVLPSVT